MHRWNLLECDFEQDDIDPERSDGDKQRSFGRVLLRRGSGAAVAGAGARAGSWELIIRRYNSGSVQVR